ncbi:MAG: ion transporter [Saprospiraceae bacterium]|nr:ion transporter [Saprospiraceae bacterium]
MASQSRRDLLHEIIFEADTPTGKLFDVVLLLLIILSVFVVMLESVNNFPLKVYDYFHVLEWAFTIIFTIEYILRLYAVRKPMKYALSFFGVIDLLAILPTYISLFLAGSHYLLIIRALRLLRVFRVFKLGQYLNAGNVIMASLKASRSKISVFLFFILLSVMIIGALMYLVEGGTNEGFSSIPKSIYWAIVTLTTVGFGDITPQTGLGQFLSAAVMILGYAVIAVPTGIVSAEFIRGDSGHKMLQNNTQSCRYCGKEGHDDDATYCKYCGEKLDAD